MKVHRKRPAPNGAGAGGATLARRYENPALTVDAVWIARGKVLLVRRARPPFRGSWALPGGFVELRETVEDAVVRELREETGLVGRPAGLVGVYSGPDRDPRKPTTTVAFFVRGRRGRPRGSDDAESAAWVPLGRVGRLAFDHTRILRDAVRLRARRTRRPSRRTAASPLGRPIPRRREAAALTQPTGGRHRRSERESLIGRSG